MSLDGRLNVQKLIVRYIDLYLDCIISPDNVGLLYHIAGKLKSVKGLDMNGEPDEDNTVCPIDPLEQGVY